MLGPDRNTQARPRNFASCSGCNLCLLVCPVWRRTHDFALTPHGRAKALQHGAAAADLAESIQGCTLCGACEPVCPEEIPLIAMTLDLRRQMPQPAAVQELRTRMEAQAGHEPSPRSGPVRALLPGPALRGRPDTMERAVALLGGTGSIRLADDDGADIALALEAGSTIASRRMEQFLRPLRALKQMVIAEGLLLRHLRPLLPGAALISLGEALSRLDAVRGALRAGDLYVIEPRAYHGDYQRLVRHYDALRAASGCAFNLDLQRIAVPATARSLPQRLGLETIDDGVQLRWIMQGRKVTRIVVEGVEDHAAFEGISALPVVHLADLADDGAS
ncbi:MAG: 4Fe-4S dicluster domain-containing protein [Burkholderiales bacterium]|nr:4Fe-4S dicluster domain-containing protein [Burkholderiales bacterium]